MQPLPAISVIHKKHKPMKYLTLLLLSLPFLVQAQTFEQRYSDVTDIHLATGSADCEVRKASGNEITVIVEHDFGDDYEPDISQNGKRLMIKDGPDRRGSGDLKYTLIVPDGTDLKLTAGSGDIRVDGLKINLSGNSGSGDITLRNTAGDVSFNNGSGDLEVSDFEGELSMNVGSGETTIDDYRGFLKVNCGSGDVEIEDIEAVVQINAGSGDVELENAVFTAKSSLNAGSGNVSVELAGALTSDLAINTGSGKGHLDMNGHAFNGTLVMEADKKKGRIDAPFSFDTTEEIRENDRVKVRKTVKMGDENIELSISTGSGVASVEE